MPTQQPNMRQIREALMLVFDDTELQAFCLDYFPELYDRFSEGMPKDQKIRLLLQHCRSKPTGLKSLFHALNNEYKYSNYRREELSPVIDALEKYIESQRNEETTSDREETRSSDPQASPFPHEKESHNSPTKTPSHTSSPQNNPQPVVQPTNNHSQPLSSKDKYIPLSTSKNVLNTSYKSPDDDAPQKNAIEMVQQYAGKLFFFYLALGAFALVGDIFTVFEVSSFSFPLQLGLTIFTAVMAVLSFVWNRPKVPTWIQKIEFLLLTLMAGWLAWLTFQ